VHDLTPSLYRFAPALSRNPQTAEDLVQETFLRAWRERDRFRGDSTPGTWLRRILHNAAVDRARRIRRELLVADVEGDWRDDAFSVDSEAVLERGETARSSRTRSSTCRSSTGRRSCCTMWRALRSRRSPTPSTSGCRRRSSACAAGG